MITACCHNNAYCYIDKPAIVAHKNLLTAKSLIPLGKYKGNFGKVEKVKYKPCFYVKTMLYYLCGYELP